MNAELPVFPPFLIEMHEKGPNSAFFPLKITETQGGKTDLSQSTHSVPLVLRGSAYDIVLSLAMKPVPSSEF
jgi:hypothetical protein